MSDSSQAVSRLDAWTNITTGIGGPGDKSSGFVFTPLLISNDLATLEYLYEEDHLSGKIVDALPDDVFRRGWALSTSEDERLREPLTDEADRLEVEKHVDQAYRWEGLYGGSAIFVGAEDGRSVTLPLDERNIKRVHYLHTFDRWELTPHRFYENPLSPKFGRPSVYRVHPRAVSSQVGMLVHETRLVLFTGRPTTKTQLIQNQYWGQSKLVRSFTAVKQYGGALASALALLADSNQGVYKIKGLVEVIRGGRGETLKARMRAIDEVRSVINAIVLDADGESYERVSTPLTEVSNIVDRFKVDVAAAAEMPVTRLFGQSPAGLNATGESDQQNWYDRVEQAQGRHIKPALERILRLVMLSQEGPTKGVQPAKWSVKFPPPWRPTAKEATEVAKMRADTDAIYVDLGVLTPAQIARARFSGSENATEEITLTPEELKALEPDLDAIEKSASVDIELAPTTVGIVLNVNEARASQGLGPKTLPDGSPDPDGFLSVAEFEAKVRGDAPAAAAPGAAPAGPPGSESGAEPTLDDEDAPSSEPTTLVLARELARKMSEAKVARCEHGKINRCQICGIERGRDFVVRDGEAVWSVTWRAIGEDHVDAGEFDESKHARDEDGQFSSTGGGGEAAEKKSAPEKAKAPASHEAAEKRRAEQRARTEKHFAESGQKAQAVAERGGHTEAIDTFLNVERARASRDEREGRPNEASDRMNAFLREAQAAGATFKGAVYRGTSEAELKQILEGGENAGTWSVSVDHAHAKGFAQKSGGVLLVIDRNSGAVPTDGLKGSNTFSECLIPRGQKWQVTEDVTGDGVRVVRLRRS